LADTLPFFHSSFCSFFILLFISSPSDSFIILSSVSFITSYISSTFCCHLSLAAPSYKECLCNSRRDRNDLDVSAVYHKLLDTYKSSDTESDVDVEAKTGPSSSRNAASLSTNIPKHREQQKRRMSRRTAAAAATIPTDWRRECRDLLEMLWSCEDSTPFRLACTLQNDNQGHTFLVFMYSHM
jgi:hypothetical protein